MSRPDPNISAERLAQWVCDARQRTLQLIADLSDEQLIGPRLEITNPLLWEVGHVAWFQEKWVLRHTAGQQPFHPDVDKLYDSVAIPHDVRWDLPLLSRPNVLDYARATRNRVLDVLSGPGVNDELAYFVQHTVFHEDMHTEAFTYTRQTLGYPPPQFDDPNAHGWQPVGPSAHGSQPVGPNLPGGTFFLGATRDEPFVFDNEKWAHPVELQPFAISRTAVTQAEFAEFVDDGGYQRPELWSRDGWTWRESAGADAPLYWRKETGGGWLFRHFDRWRPLEPNWPMIHVNWYEAEAFCRWAGRRLPTEAEWEAAASLESSDAPGSAPKRRYPWGDDPPTPERVHMDWMQMGPVDVTALPTGDSAVGCRQMIGNVWEWTADDFGPYPGFVPDPYKEYSQPWFGDHKVLRGGCWATRSRMIRNTWRNFYKPHRRDVFAGFRTCWPTTR